MISYILNNNKFYLNSIVPIFIFMQEGKNTYLYTGDERKIVLKELH